MNLDKAIAKTRRNFEALDFTRLNERMAELNVEFDKLREAELKASARVQEIRSMLQEPRTLDPNRVANMLLEAGPDANIGIAMPSRDSLENERENLSQGAVQLRARQDGNRSEMERVKQTVRNAVFEAMAPLREQVESEARAAAETVAQCYAALKGIYGTANKAGGLLSPLSDMVLTAMRGEKVIPGRKESPVPAEIVALVESLEGRGEAVDVRIRSAVPPH